jgi:hypothetical protein
VTWGEVVDGASEAWVLDWSMCELRTNNSATITATTTASTPTAIVR